MNSINNPAQLQALLTMFVTQLPILLVSLVGCVMMVGRWNQGSRSAAWALAGFGISLALCVLMPLGQIQMQKWLAECGQNPVDPARAFAVLTLFWSVLRAISYGCLLMALLAGRQRFATANPSVGGLEV